jgi:hypothetical protein
MYDTICIPLTVLGNYHWSIIMFWGDDTDEDGQQTETNKNPRKKTTAIYLLQTGVFSQLLTNNWSYFG